MANIISRECKFVLYPPYTAKLNQDVHFIKEVITYDNGEVKLNLRILKDFERPFWITKKIYQNYKQKKESESIDRLDMFKSTQSNLHKAIAARLGSKYIGCKSMRDVIDSPYLYGTDVSTKAIIKKLYQTKYPNANTLDTIAILDIETDIDTDELVIISVATYEEVFIGILNKIVKNIRDVEKQLQYIFNKYIPKTDITSKIQPIFKFYNTEIELLQGVLEMIHNYKKDFVAIWNIDYDIPFLVKVCKRNNVDPKDVFSHPCIPKELRYFEYKEGSKLKVTESGVHKPIRPEEQWHVVYTPSYSYWIDAMSLYSFIRQGEKKIPGGYSLNNILEKELNKDLKKLKFENEVNTNLVGIDWHKYMLKYKPLEYIIYNAWDTMSILELDNRTKDLAVSIRALAEVSAYDIFNSGPKQTIDSLHFFYLSNNRVLATKGRTIDDDNLLGLANWIVMLETDYIEQKYTDVIEEGNFFLHNVNLNTLDYDSVSSYPSCIEAANVSKDTTVTEVLDIKGIPKDVFMLQNINYTFGNVNAADYCRTMLNYPTLDELLNSILKKEKNKNEN